MENLLNKIITVVAEGLNISEDEISRESALTDDLGADSLDILTLCMDVEEEFGVEIPEKDLENIRTIQEIVDYVDSRKTTKKKA